MDASTALNTVIPQTVSSADWGRKTKAQLRSTLGCLGLIVCCPMLIVLNWVALERYNGSLSATIRAAIAHGPATFLLHNLPTPTVAAFLGYAGWVLFQSLLYAVLPGPTAYGQQTPGGNLLKYTTNGLTAWAITHLLFLTASILGLLDPAIIARNWGPLLLAANTYGFLTGLLAHLKGHISPTHPTDNKKSSNPLFDFWAGIELNPRLGKHFDLKFLHNSRIGIAAWTLVDLSWATHQLRLHGHITPSTLVLLVLHTVYVTDFFVNEDWYTRTIDISHDHFGFMLSWGDSTFLPAFYTLQAQYLALYPTHLSLTQSCAILALGLTSYTLFRSANAQRDAVRRTRGHTKIWFRPATFIRCQYTTADGKQHDSLLLTSGWWGVARHANYLCDLVQSWAFCATCGFSNLLPWSYFVFMCVLLWHRSGRDEERCRRKYGREWEEYCRVVPWRIVPGVY